MPTAEDIIQELYGDISDHEHHVIDSDTYFIINPITRQISNTASSKNVLMQYDHNSERFTFEIPRFIEGHDMLLCNSVKVHYDNTNSETGEVHKDVYDVQDLHAGPDGSEIVLCSWLISRYATMLFGSLSFSVHYACVDNNGTALYEWHSDDYSDIEIRKGRNNGEAAVTPYSDILEEWRSKLTVTNNRKFDLTLPLANWVEHDNGEYYTQDLGINVSASSKIDLHPTANQMLTLVRGGISMFVSNEEGVATIYAVGGIPESDFTIGLTEVVVNYI